jgi:hypothetical protein
VVIALFALFIRAIQNPSGIQHLGALSQESPPSSVESA